MAGATTMSRRPRKNGRAESPRAGPKAVRRATPAAVAEASIAGEPPQRIDAVDALRGGAICMMIVYHAAFDLNWFHIINADFNHHPFWLGFRDLIVTSFLLLVGISLLLARRAGISRARFWRRIALVGACAMLVTAGSYAAFPKTFITFGILQCIVVSSILSWPLTRFPRAAWMVGLAAIVAGAAIGVTLFDPPWSSGVALFDQPWLNWVGWVTRRPATEDYVPLLPWFGVVLVGISVGGWLMERRLHALKRISRASPRWLTWLGRHSLLVYMIHQPIMIGLLRVLHG
jgi:uncharacterized membrane protein